jgi:hypothetical protein
MRQIKIRTAAALLHIFWPDFVEVDGSVFLAHVKPKATSDPEHGLDRTGMEAFLNHTHMIDLFNHDASLQPIDEDDDRFYDPDHPDFSALCEVGMILAQMWFQKLRVDFPQYGFRVYYSQADNPIVRFHRIRIDEPNWLDENDYSEEIQLGKLIIYDTRKTSPVRGRA